MPRLLPALLLIPLVTAAATADTRPALNPKLANLPANQWTVLHQQSREDKVRFKQQEHGGSCLDTKRNRIVLFGSNTHGQDWTNSPLIFDIATATWSRVYENDPPSTYKANEKGLAVAGESGNHPWAMHTFGAVEYDPERDEMVVCSWPEHLRPGKFTKALADVWPTVKKHATWTFSFQTSKWTPLPCEPEHFFPYATAYDPDQKRILGYGGRGIFELKPDASGERTWSRLEKKSLCGYHNNVVYDPDRKALIVYGSNENSDDVIVYQVETKEHKKMPTPGVRPPKDQHTPMCYEAGLKKTVVIVDRGGGVDSTKEGKAETWLYDLASDSWQQIPTATLPFGCGMNYDFHYDPLHKVCLLVTEDMTKSGWPVTVYAIRIEAIKQSP
jgi:hypothetical protein